MNAYNSFFSDVYARITRQFWGSAPRSEVDLEEFRNSRLSWTDQYGHSFGKFLTKDIVVEDMKNLEVLLLAEGRFAVAAHSSHFP